MRHATSPQPRFLYDGRDSQLTRTDLWAWSDALRRLDRPSGGEAAAPGADQPSEAQRAAWRSRLPLALIICGPPASGKSALARALARQSGLPVVCVDETRKAVVDTPFATGAPRGARASDTGELAYAMLGHEAARLLISDGGVIVDATFGRRRLREAFAQAFGVKHPTIFCECRAPVDVLRRRARARLTDPWRTSAEPASVVSRLDERFEALESDISPENHVVLRSDRPTSDLLDDLLAMLDSRVARAAPALRGR